jgi:ketosteroid isomerase-like protein
MPERKEIARSSYLAYAESNRKKLETILADDFVFWSPRDDGLDRVTYFERCWPNHETTESFEFLRLFERGDEVFVTYRLTKADGGRFRNTEVLTFKGDKITRAEVYFGWNE